MEDRRGDQGCNIDRVLRDNGLRRIVRYPYTVGDCLFDSVFYLLREGVPYTSSVALRRAMVKLYRKRILAQDPKAVEWLQNFLVLENLQEIHPELHSVAEQDAAFVYLCRMQHSALRGGLWGDHFCAFWLQELLGRPIEIWMADTGRVLGDEKENREDGDLVRLVYHSNYEGCSFAHYEPVEVFEWGEVLEENLPDEKLEEESESETESDWSDDEDDDDNDDDNEFWLPERVAFDLQQPSRPKRLFCEFQNEEEAAMLAAETLKTLPDIGSSNFPKRLKTDFESGKQKPATSTKVVDADCGKLCNLEVLEILRSRAAENGFDSKSITKSEVLVYGYLIQTPAATQNLDCLKQLSQDPLIRRLRPLEQIQVANLRPDHVQLYLIISKIEERFSNDEIDAIVATVNRFLMPRPSAAA